MDDRGNINRFKDSFIIKKYIDGNDGMNILVKSEVEPIGTRFFRGVVGIRFLSYLHHKIG